MARAMPEIVHGENALLGSTGEEIAEHVVAACRDETLRRRIIEGGRRTWEREFRPEVVVERIVRRVESDLRLGSGPLPQLAPLLLHVTSPRLSRMWRGSPPGSLETTTSNVFAPTR